LITFPAVLLFDLGFDIKVDSTTSDESLLYYAAMHISVRIQVVRVPVRYGFQKFMAQTPVSLLRYGHLYPTCCPG